MVNFFKHNHTILTGNFDWVESRQVRCYSCKFLYSAQYTVFKVELQA